MKKFMTPEVEIIKFAMQDVITVSGEPEEEIPDIGGMTLMGNCVS